MLSRAKIGFSLLLLLGLGAYVALLPPTSMGETHLETCPASLAGLPGTELGLDQTVVDDLAADAFLSRLYERPDGVPLWLMVVYFENARLGAHDPILCYQSQGFEVEFLPDETLETALGPVPMKRFRAVRGDRVEKVNYFWYTAGQKALAEVRTFRDQMFLQGLRENRSFGAFVRISTLEIPDEKTAGSWIDRMVGEFAPLLPSFFPEEPA